MDVGELIEFADLLIAELEAPAADAMELAALCRTGHTPAPHPPPGPLRTKEEAAAALFKSIVLTANLADGQALAIGRLWAELETGLTNGAMTGLPPVLPLSAGARRLLGDPVALRQARNLVQFTSNRNRLAKQALMGRPITLLPCW